MTWSIMKLTKILDLTPQVSSNSQTISSNMDTIRQEGKLETFGAIEETLLFDYQGIFISLFWIDNKENAWSNIRRNNKQEIQCIQPIINQAKDKNIKVNESQWKAAVQQNTKDYVIFDIK